MAIEPGLLQNRTALITGGARRVGSYIAEELARAGCHISIHYNHSAQAAEKLASQLHQKYKIQTTTVSGDLNDPTSCATIIQQSKTDLGPLNILINNASIYEDKDVLQTTADDLQRNLNIHTISPFLLSRAFFEQCQDHKATIINMLDYKVLQANANRFAYSLSKAALAHMTGSLALAFAPHVRVNGLALGAILPPIDNPQVDPELWVADVPQKSWGSAREIGELVVMLAREPGYINGEIIQVDGGAHLV